MSLVLFSLASDIFSTLKVRYDLNCVEIAIKHQPTNRLPVYILNVMSSVTLLIFAAVAESS